MSRRIAIAALIALGLSGCGVRGNLDVPGAAAGQTEPTASADSGQGKKAGEALKPHKSTILDGLLQ